MMPLHLCVIICTVTNPFALRFGNSELAIALPLALLVLGGSVLIGNARIDAARLTAWALVVALIALLTAFASHNPTLTSLGLLSVTYFLLTFSIPCTPEERTGLLEFIQKTLLVIAVVGICQFILQFAFRTPAFFSLHGFVPEALLKTGVNTVIPLSYGASIFKSNAWVFAEPSGLSQAMGLAIAVDLLVLGIRRRTAVFGLCQLLTYSGTGMIMTVCALLLAFWVKGNWRVLAALAIGACLLLPFTDALNIGAITRRLNEFNTTESSAFARFISPMWIVSEYSLPHPDRFLIGYGAGSVSDILAKLHYEGFDPTWAKAFLEYGLIGSVAILGYTLFPILVGGRFPALGVVHTVQFLFLGGFLLSPQTVLMIGVIHILPRRNGDPAAQREKKRHPSRGRPAGGVAGRPAASAVGEMTTGWPEA